jgi:hypothetical protein
MPPMRKTLTMTKSRPHPEEPDLEWDRLVDEIFGHANPNPGRSGCLSAVTLFELANRRRDLADPGWRHLTKCSPCYREFIAMRESGQRSH